MSETRPKPSIDGAAAISVEHVRKVYGATVAVDDASFSIARGAVHALLGENGAGKSTIVKLLSGLAQPEFGRISPVRRGGALFLPARVLRRVASKPRSRR